MYTTVFDKEGNLFKYTTQIGIIEKSTIEIKLRFPQ